MKITYQGSTLAKIYEKTHKFDLEDNYNYLKLKTELQGKCYMIILLYDPTDKLRIQYHFQPEYREIILSDNDQYLSPGVLNGPLIKGRWTLKTIINSTKNHINKDNNYKIILYASKNKLNLKNDNTLKSPVKWADYNCKPPLSLNKYKWDKTYNTTSKWYKGDLHAHTICSDGMLKPDEELQVAIENDLDFYFTTDHNFLPLCWEKSNILVIPGVEVTLEHGHFNAFALSNLIDFSNQYGSEKLSSNFIKQINNKSEFISINHAFFKKWEWKYVDSKIEDFQTMEIICDPQHPDAKIAAQKALKAWKTLLNDGHRIWAVGGSDTHLRKDYQKYGRPPTQIGDPATFVLSKSLSAHHIIGGIKNGKSYQARGFSMRPEFIIGEQYFSPGSDLSFLFSNNTKHKIKCNIEIKSTKYPLNLQLILNGRPINNIVVKKSGKYEYKLELKGNKYEWLSVEIRDSNCQLIGLVNPVFKGKKKNTITHWSQLIKKMEES